MENRELIRLALEARKLAYAPYSGFSVGAALLTADGKVYTGCNIENAGYTATNCAERTAFFKAVSEGMRRFVKIAVTGGPEGTEPVEYCAPCGVCRQVMAEFCQGDFTVLLAKSLDDYKECRLSELLPFRFGPENLAQKEAKISESV